MDGFKGQDGQPGSKFCENQFCFLTFTNVESIHKHKTHVHISLANGLRGTDASNGQSGQNGGNGNVIKVKLIGDSNQKILVQVNNAQDRYISIPDHSQKAILLVGNGGNGGKGGNGGHGGPGGA